MDTAKQAKEVLSAAEKQLRELVGTAAAGGEYESAERIMRWARVVGTLTRDSEATAPSTPELSANRSSCDRVRRRSAGRRRSSGTLRGDRHLAYPRFFRRGEQLVKIGWSKKEKAEYEHKAPRRVVDALTAAIARRSGNGKLFTVEDLLPLKDPKDGSEMPGYQVYVTLAWLRTVGLVDQRGREGYRVASPSTLDARVREAWNNVQEAT
jgi:predicted nucleic acid-binding protein